MAFRLFLFLEPQTHIDEDNHYKNNGKRKDSIAYHKLLVRIQTMCHKDAFIEFRDKDTDFAAYT